MAFNTGNPVPSTDAKDLSDNAENFDGAVNLQSDTWVDRLGITRDTVNGRIKKMGYIVPVAYAGGISFATNDNVKTVEEVGVVYAPLPSALPFTTSGTFVGGDDAKFFVVQGLTIYDTSVVHVFDNVAAYKAFPTAFPVGKVIQLKDRGADFVVIAGTGTANTFDIIASNTTGQSVDIKPNNGQVSVEQIGDFVRACEYASINNLKCILENDITITGVIAAALVSVTGYFDFDSQGNTITDDKVYVDGEFGVLFEALNCDPLIVKANTVSQNAIDVGGFIQDVGWIVVQPKQGCNNVDIKIRTQGGMGGLQCNRLSTDPESFRTRNIKAQVKSKNTHYPYEGQFSGDNANIEIDADTCGRNYFIYGCDNVDIDVVSVNQQKTSFVNAFEGKGCTNVTVKETDTLSNNCQPAANHSTLRFGDGTAAIHRNIEFIFNIVNPTASWGNSFEISKYNGASPDTVGRGHVLDGLKVRGYINNIASGNSPITTVGAFNAVDTGTGADYIDHFDFEHLTAPGGSSTLAFQALKNTASFKNVNTGGANFFVLTNNTSKTTFENVTAGNITANTASTDNHIYISSTISDGSTQNLADNKTFIDCVVAGISRTILRQNNIGIYTAQASQYVNGFLGAQTNIFKILTVATGMKMQLSYYLVGDGADTNPATRDETIGIKVLSATLSSGGIWVGQISATNEVAELSQGTATALNVTLVNGDATGAFIAIDCPTYNSAGNRGVFKIEVISYSPIFVESV